MLAGAVAGGWAATRWRYANVHEGACDGDIVLVAEDGRLDLVTTAATRPSA